jgi:hypothetical protein
VKVTSRISLLLAGTVMLAGCATEHKVVLTGDALVDGQNALSNGPAKDKVLWQYRMGAAAMRQGRFDLAKQELDNALLTVQGIFGPDSEARKSRGYFHPESKKTFIGEPYERSMAYIYRGIIYWMDGQPDNARACFKSAEFEDSDTADKKYAGDWVLPDYLDGFVTKKSGGDGMDAWNRAHTNCKNINLPPYQLQANVLLVVEFGAGPTKVSGGKYGEELRFRVAQPHVLSARIRTEGLDFPVAPCDDVYFQATTRGGRVMDHILANKAVFKSTTDTVGNIGLMSGAMMAAAGSGSSSAADEVGLGLMLAGLAAKLISASTTPQADVRCWDNLPRFISFATMTLPPGPHTITAEFLDNMGNIIANLTKTITVNVPDGGDEKVVFVSDRMTSPQTQ